MTETRPPNFRTSAMNIDRPGDASIFGDDVRAAAAEIIARYPAGQARSALLPMLHLVQSEQGNVTADGIAFCAEVLDLTKAQVAAVVTFYTMFKRRPTGEFLVSVCRNPLCGLLGGDDIYAALSESLGIGMNETTADGTITLEHAECLAACDYAPVLTVNYEFFDQQTVASAMSLMQDLRSGQRPMPTRGAPLSTFREIERLIAGFPDPRSDALEFEASGAPTEAGVRLAVDRGESAPSYATRDQDDQSSEPPSGATAQRPTGQQQTSEHDAPLSTAESDPDHPAQPAGQKES